MQLHGKLFAGLLVSLGIALLGSSSAQAATFTVTNTNPNGPGSLRQAMLDANANPDHDTITFNIPGTGPHVIEYVHEIDAATLGSLPSITTPMTIDGCSQPGSDCNISSLNLMIELKGGYEGTGVNMTGVGTANAGFYIQNTSNVTIRGISTYNIKQQSCRLLGGQMRCSTGFVDTMTIANSSNVLIEKNIIGTDNAGTGGLRSASSTSPAISLSRGSSNNRIAENIIAVNGYGVQVSEGGASAYATNNLIEGNIIGTNNNAATTLGGGNGVNINPHARSTTIRGNTMANLSNGVSAGSYRSSPLPQMYNEDTVVVGNTIGIAPNGQPLGVATGVTTGCARRAVIGGLAPGEGNVIANTSSQGIQITSSSGCTIGTHDVQVLGNTVYNSARSGILVIQPAGAIIDSVTMRRNSIYSVGTIPIDLSVNDWAGDGRSPNDLGDSDAGPNTLINFPVINTATPSAGSLSVTGTYNSLPNQTYTLDFYAAEQGLGQIWLGETNVTTDSTGNASFIFTYNNSLSEGLEITATATDSTGNTSEFSDAVSLPAADSSIAGMIYNDGNNNGIYEPGTDASLPAFAVPTAGLPQRHQWCFKHPKHPNDRHVHLRWR